MYIKNKPKGHFENDETIPQRRPKAFGYAAMPLVDLDLPGPREPENHGDQWDQLLGISGGLSFWQQRGAHPQGPEELFMVFSTCCFPARKSLSIYTLWRTSSRG